VVSFIPVLGEGDWIAWILNLGVRSTAVGLLFFFAGWALNLSPDLSAMIKSKLSK
jgi:hypothetical protein